MSDATTRARRLAGMRELIHTQDWQLIEVVLLQAADEIDRLKAENARLREAAETALKTLMLWEPHPQPAMKQLSAALYENDYAAALNQQEGTGDE